MVLISVARIFGKLYYWLTAYVPRRLPTTEAQYDRFKNVLVDCYGVPNEPQVWALVSGQIASTPAHKLRKSWGHIANAAKRLGINGLAQRHGAIARAVLTEKVEAAAKKQKDIMMGIDALFTAYPAAYQDLLKTLPEDRAEAIEFFTGELMERWPDEGSDTEWAQFLPVHAVHFNVKRAEESSNGTKAAQKLPQADAEPGPRVPKNGNS